MLIWLGECLVSPVVDGDETHRLLQFGNLEFQGRHGERRWSISRGHDLRALHHGLQRQKLYTQLGVRDDAFARVQRAQH